MEMETEKLNYQDALTEAVAVKHVAKSLVEMEICGEDMSLQMASEYLDALVEEDPETRNLLMAGSNLWAEIENMTSESNLILLTSSSQDISKKPKGKELIRRLSQIIDDKDETIRKAKEFYADDKVLSMVLNSNPKLEEKWYDHLYVTFKMALKVNDEKTNG